MAALLTGVICMAALGSALWLGGPAPIAPLASINQPFSRVDFSRLPPLARYAARDGQALAYRRYGPAPDAADARRRIVLVHGSSAHGQSMHPLAEALARAGFTVDALDMRGHGSSGPRGDIAYVGQLEDDLEDFVRQVPFAGPGTLLGFSSGGGFVLRVAGGARQGLFDRYVLLSPYLRHDAPTARPDNGDWASVGVPRLLALRLLNRLGVTRFNHLPVVRFALDDAARAHLTPSYSHALAASFGPRGDYAGDIAHAPPALRALVGGSDELFYPDRFDAVFAAAGKPGVVTVVPGIDHIGMTLAPAALDAVVAACRQAPPKL
ncbi:MAG: alpha/beta fold hydrolase [Ottowia sp.]|uniref:alpha/beta hydrolase n=1 Tax=Ottowia sp. TaxID=1898956 RepID=UPI0039E60933